MHLPPAELVTRHGARGYTYRIFYYYMIFFKVIFLNSLYLLNEMSDFVNLKSTLRILKLSLIKYHLIE